MSNITPHSSTPDMPLIVFKVGEMTCAVDGASVISIQRMEEFTLTPHTPDEIFGSINFRNHVISILDLRTVFGLPTRIKEYSDFVKMLDQRKQDHIKWVTMLIVLDDKEPIAIAVDEVIAVTNLEEVVVEKESLMHGNLVQRFLKGKSQDDIIYHLNHEVLFKKLMDVPQ